MADYDFQTDLPEPLPKKPWKHGSKTALLNRLGNLLFSGTIKKGTAIFTEKATSALLIFGKARQSLLEKINREETYSVVEWDGKGPEIRTSMEEEEEGIAIATAGLYEIEELISELQEDNPLLGEGLKDSEYVDKSAEAEGNDSLQDCITEQSVKVKLLIRMEVSAQKGLRAIPKWESNKSDGIPVYAHEASDIENCDRPALMRFVTEAGKHGFKFQKEAGDFLLKDWKKLPNWQMKLSRIGKIPLSSNTVVMLICSSKVNGL